MILVLPQVSFGSQLFFPKNPSLPRVWVSKSSATSRTSAAFEHSEGTEKTEAINAKNNKLKSVDFIFDQLGKFGGNHWFIYLSDFLNYFEYFGK
jgi:hypothetical protein